MYDIAAFICKYEQYHTFFGMYGRIYKQQAMPEWLPLQLACAFVKS